MHIRLAHKWTIKLNFVYVHIIHLSEIVCTHVNVY